MISRKSSKLCKCKTDVSHKQTINVRNSLSLCNVNHKQTTNRKLPNVLEIKSTKYTCNGIVYETYVNSTIVIYNSKCDKISLILDIFKQLKNTVVVKTAYLYR